MTYGKGGEYTVVEFGLNCMPDTIIDNRVTCVDALQQLGITIAELNVNKTDRPAGCYWKSGYYGFFNSMVNTTLTEPSLFGDRGGVCRGTDSGMNKKTRAIIFKVLRYKKTNG